MRLTEQVHRMLKEVLKPGDTAIDATAGNGHDCLKMAESVGPTGKVFAVDLQSPAIEATRARLREAGQLTQCTLLKGDHAEILGSLTHDQRDSAAVITFNLGYLPGGAKEVTTAPETTTLALDAARILLKPGGVLLVTAYRGHAGGMEEARQVESWMRARPEAEWRVEAREPPTRDPERIPPILWIARKLGGGLCLPWAKN